VKRMLADPKASALADNFAAQWLNLRLLDRKKPDAERFPTVDDELLDAMRRETLMFVTALVREDRSILDVIDGRFTFLNGPLARHYGIKGIDGEAFQRVDLQGGERGGIVTQGSILTLSSYATRTSPVLRGKWVLENLLGTPLPPPSSGRRKYMQQSFLAVLCPGVPRKASKDRHRIEERGHRLADTHRCILFSSRSFFVASLLC